MTYAMFVTVTVEIQGEKGVFIKKFEEHDLEQRTEHFLEEAWQLYKVACQHLQTNLYSNLVVRVTTNTMFYHWDHISGYRESFPVPHRTYSYVFERMPFWVNFQP